MKCGALVVMNNYIRLPLSDGQFAVVCLDLLVIGYHASVIGNPEEYSFNDQCTAMPHYFVCVEHDGKCPRCGEVPCDWMVFGPKSVEAINRNNG